MSEKYVQGVKSWQNRLVVSFFHRYNNFKSALFITFGIPTNPTTLHCAVNCFSQAIENHRKSTSTQTQTNGN